MRILHLLPILCLAVAVQAQQAPIFSQFFYQKNLTNPAATGSQGQPSLAVLHRQQWAGLDGAPSTQALSFHAPAFADRVGLGLSVVNDRIGFSNATYVQAAYAYRIRMGEGTLSVGLQGSYQQQRTDWGEARTIGLSTDPNAAGDDLVPVFNVGAGVYFQDEKIFVGLAVPQLLEKGFTRRNAGFVEDGSGIVRHVMATAGLVTDLSPKVKMRPALSARIVTDAPPSLDAHVSFGFLPAEKNSRLWLGGTLRWSQSEVPAFGDALVATCQYQMSERLLAGLAYDLALGELRQSASGTYELMLEYVFVKKEMAVKNPRYFW